MNKISDYIFRQLFPDFNLRPVDYVLFPSHPFFLKAQLVEKDGVFSFSIEQPFANVSAIAVRFRLRYKTNFESMRSNSLIAYLELLDRDPETISRLMFYTSTHGLTDEEKFNRFIELNTFYPCSFNPVKLNEEIRIYLNAYKAGYLYAPLIEEINKFGSNQLKTMCLKKLNGFHEQILTGVAEMFVFKDGKTVTTFIEKSCVIDPCDHSPLYAFADKILNPPLVNK